MKYPFYPRFICLLIVACLVSCGRKSYDSVGYMTAAFANETEAESVISKGPFSVSSGKAEFLLTPRPRPSGGHVVNFDIVVARSKDMKIAEEKELVDLIMPAIGIKPLEIYGLAVPRLKHSQSSYNEASDLKGFVDYFIEFRPHAGYGVSEVRSILPKQYREQFDRQVIGSSFQVVLDWPFDERNLSMTFKEDNEQQAILLQSFGLDYTELKDP